MLKNLKEKAIVATMLAVSSGLTFAQTTPSDPISEMFDAVDLGGVTAKVVAAGLLIVAISLAFKAPSLAKRVISKV